MGSPCPAIFVNDVPNYPPCPSFEAIPPIPLDVVVTLVTGFIVLLWLLTLVVMAALLVATRD